MGLLVEYPKPGGSGSINKGTMTRRFFQNPAMLYKITRIDVTLMDQFATILQALSSGFEIDS